jgi:hypothetical protein
MTRRQLLITYCTDCGRVLVRTATGFVCPAGCGRIQPLMYDVRSGPYPTATRISQTRRYTLDGLPGNWRTAVARPVLRSWRARVAACLPADVRQPDWQIGRWRDRLIWFRPVEVCLDQSARNV